ncbi:hypothetical protein LINGRAHAP2_LOCUS27997, partial [Linum grandiflorum]
MEEISWVEDGMKVGLQFLSPWPLNSFRVAGGGPHGAYIYTACGQAPLGPFCLVLSSAQLCWTIS